VLQEVYAGTILKPSPDSHTTRRNQDMLSLCNSTHSSPVIEVCIMHEVVGCPDYKRLGVYEAPRIFSQISQLRCLMEISGKPCIKLHVTYEHTLEMTQAHVVNTRIGHYFEYVCTFCSYRVPEKRRCVGGKPWLFLWDP
jgi:hypothetical protein